MKQRPAWVIPLILGVGFVSLMAYFISRGTVALLSPAGTIAAQERNIIVFAALLSSVVVIPVFGLTIWIVWRYRATNMHAAYDPHWDHNRLIETIWWLIPSALIAILAVVAWRSSHTLDPSVALQSDKPTLNVQVVALQWKWLFIYPDQGVASVNKLMMPVDRAVHFDITADAPMNSFWIPQLGGQIYAMPGMSTQLNLEASRAGIYHGSSANISGAGFADMEFSTYAVSPTDFGAWASQLRHQNAPLSTALYNHMRAPGTSQPKEFSSLQSDIFQLVLNHYMGGHGSTTMGMSQ